MTAPRYATADGNPWPWTPPATFPLAREEWPGGWSTTAPKRADFPLSHLNEEPALRFMGCAAG